MSTQRFTREFKVKAARQVTERGLRVADVAELFSVSVHSIYVWIRRYSKPQEQRQQEGDQQADSQLNKRPPQQECAPGDAKFCALSFVRN